MKLSSKKRPNLGAQGRLSLATFWSCLRGASYIVLPQKLALIREHYCYSETPDKLTHYQGPAHMLPTPSTTHVSFDTIYEPAEDSYLLLDTLSSSTETSWLQTRFPRTTPCPLLVEIGTGSGVVIAFLAAHAKTIFGREDVLALGVDVNANACAATVETLSKAQSEQGAATAYLGSVCGDLTSSVLEGEVDVMVFNPPYVPTLKLPALPGGGRIELRSGFEADSHLLSLSYAGGVDGMETTYRLLEALPKVLSRRGVAYVLLCVQNRPEDVKNFVGSALKLHVETVGTSGKVAGWEKLQIIRIWR
jgi:release factor glutamine methyltransferase